MNQASDFASTRRKNPTSRKPQGLLPKQATKSSTRIAERAAQKSVSQNQTPATAETKTSAPGYKLRNTASRIARSSKNKESQKPKATQRRSRTARPRQPAEKAAGTGGSATKVSKFDTWIKELEPGKPPARPPRKPKDTLNISGSFSRTGSGCATTQSSSTMTARSVKTTSKMTASNLMNHGILVEHDKTHPDKLKQDLKTRLVTRIPREPAQTLEPLIEALKKAIPSNSNDLKERVYSWLDELRYQLDECACLTFHPFTHQRYFKYQLEKCKARNEHFLQRTVMMSIFQPYWLPRTFDWNVEGQWQHDKGAGPFASSSQKGALTKAQEKLGSIPRPKPDMAFAFSRETFMSPTEEVRLPMDLRLAMKPDDSNQVFPFLFIEVKKGYIGIEEAKLKNLNNAARALYNIQRWFKKAEDDDGSQDWKASFLDIRVFSFAFNADNLVVRMHRAEPESLSQDPLFYFEELFSQKPYTRNQICTLFNNILNDYAANDLRTSLEAVFQAVFNSIGATRDRSSQVRERATSAGEDDSGNADEDDYYLHDSDDADNDSNSEGGVFSSFPGPGGRNSSVQTKRKAAQRASGAPGTKRAKSLRSARNSKD